MHFNYDTYGIHALTVSEADAEAEAHYDLVLRWNNMTPRSSDEVELTRGLPEADTIEFILALRETCDRALRSLRGNR